MTPEVLMAICTLVGTIGGSTIGAIASARLTNWRIEQLEKKVDKHNNLIERMTKVEMDAQVQKNDIKELEKDINALWNSHRDLVKEVAKASA